MHERWQAQGFTVASLARASGVSRRTLERIATSQPDDPYRPSPATVHALAGPLGLNADALGLLAAGGDIEPAVMDAVLSAGGGGVVTRSEMDQVRAELDVLTSEYERLRRLVEG